MCFNVSAQIVLNGCEIQVLHNYVCGIFFFARDFSFLLELFIYLAYEIHFLPYLIQVLFGTLHLLSFIHRVPRKGGTI